LIYTVLTGLLALVFFGVVTLLSGLLTAAAGQQSAPATRPSRGSAIDSDPCNLCDP
jgi:hypothetical protein